MTTTHKYQLEVTESQVINMPAYAEILSVQVQDNQICLWARVNPGAATEPRTFSVFMTGAPLPIRTQHLGTVQMGWMELHVFETI